MVELLLVGEAPNASGRPLSSGGRLDLGNQGRLQLSGRRCRLESVMADGENPFVAKLSDVQLQNKEVLALLALAWEIRQLREALRPMISPKKL